MTDKHEKPASDSDMKKLLKKQAKWDDTVDDLTQLYHGFDVNIVNKLANSMSGMQDSMETFLDTRMKSVAGFGDDINSAFRQTLKWGDRITFDIRTIAESNIRNSRDMIDNFSDMQTDTGKFLETRLVELSNELLTADQEKAVQINAEMSEIRNKAELLIGEEKERLLALTGVLGKGLNTITTSTSLMKGALMDALPTIDNLAENMLGGGILGKFAGSMIRRHKAQKHAKAKISAETLATRQTDAVNASGMQAGGSELMEGGGELSIAQAISVGQATMIEELKSHGSLFRSLVSSSLGIEEAAQEQGELAVSVEEGEREAAREEERRHDENIAAMGKDGKPADGSSVGGGGMFSGFLAGIVGILQGQWMMKAATFLLSPIKKMVGLVAGGIGKAVSFMMPTKWTEGLKGFFKSTGKGQADLMKSTKTSGGFIKKFIGSIKNIFKGIGSFIKTIFKTIGKVLSSIGEGIAGFMKSLAKGIGYFGKANVLLGALALTVVAGGVWVLSKAMVEFTKVSWKAVGVAAVSILVLVGSLATIGALMMSGIGAVALLAGAAAMVVVAGAMWVLGKALQEIGLAVPMFMPLIGVLKDLGNIKMGIGFMSAAGGLIALTTALAAFMAVGVAGSVAGAVGGVVTGVLDWFSGRETKDPMDILTGLGAFAESAPNLKQGSDGIYLIIKALRDFSKLKINNGEIAETITMIASLGGAVTAFMGGNSGVMGSFGDLIGGVLKSQAHIFKSLFGLNEDKKNPLEVLREIGRMAPQLREMGPAISDLTEGMLTVLSFKDANISSKFFELFTEGLNLISADKIKKKTSAITELAKSIKELTNNVVEFQGVGGVGMVLNNTQDANNALRNNTINAPINNTTVVNNNTNYSSPISSRNHERTLNDIMRTTN